MEKLEKNNKNIQKKQKIAHKSAIIGLAVATSILGASTLGLGIAYGIAQSQANNYSLQLDNIYKKNYYELVDNVNSADTQISKLLVARDENYIAKMLGDLSQTAKEMQSSVTTLPITNDNLVMSVRFINQMSGYTQVLEDKIAEGGELSDADRKTLNAMHESLTEMKRFLNQMSLNMMNGYSIFEASTTKDGNINKFTIQISGIQTSDVEYPSMIYDGPFSDSVVNQKIVGLKGEEISKEEAYKVVDKVFKNISNIRYQGKTSGRFETYNFEILNSDGNHLYVQISKIGGNVLTLNGNVKSKTKNIDFERAKKIGLNFAEQNGIENGEVVWSQELDGQVYLNIAPTQSGVALYPDLVKVKVDMENAEVVGYDAIPYWTNHTNRKLSDAKITVGQAKENIENEFEIKNSRLVLSPLDFNREVLCWEFECEKNGATYYFYINAENGITENILKVLNTTDGSKLM